jgi:hypothetical protein
MRNVWKLVGDEIHIQLERKAGVPLFSRISPQDFDRVDAFGGKWVIKWNETAKTFYARNNATHGWCSGYMHRIILGVTDRAVQIDHADHDGLNNTRINLVKSNCKLNGFNRRGAEVGSISGLRNVYWNAREKKYMVWFVHNGKRYYFGYFTDAQEADTVAQHERAKFIAEAE